MQITPNNPGYPSQLQNLKFTGIGCCKRIENLSSCHKKTPKSPVGFGIFLRKVEGTTTATGATDVSQRKGREGISGLNFCEDSRLAEKSLQNLRKIGVCAIFYQSIYSLG